MTIEERVTILESQVVEIEEDVIGLRVDHTQLEGDVSFLFDEQVIQDERLFSLEQTVFVIDEEVEGNCYFSLFTELTVTFRLHFLTFEESGRKGGNSLVAELEVRME